MDALSISIPYLIQLLANHAQDGYGILHTIYDAKLIERIKELDPKEEFHKFYQLPKECAGHNPHVIQIWNPKVWREHPRHQHKLKEESEGWRSDSLARDKAREKAITCLRSLLSCKPAEAEKHLDSIIAKGAFQSLKMMGCTDEEIEIIKKRGY